MSGNAGSIAIFNYEEAGTISGNTVSQAVQAIAVNHSSGTIITNNIITSSDTGIHTDNAGDFNLGNDVISGNSISSMNVGSIGITTYEPYLDVTVSNNTISDVEAGLESTGAGKLTPTSPVGTATFSDNLVSTVTGDVNSIGAS